MRTVILYLTYANDIDHSTVEALVDSHTQDEGVVAVSASQVTEPYVRILDGEDDADGHCGSEELHEAHPIDEHTNCIGTYPGD